MSEVSFLAALTAGILSFISPCVLPLVPGYISFISGVSFNDMQATGAAATRSRRQMLITSLAFVLGFSLVFIAAGASASAIGRAVGHYRPIIERIAGLLVIFFGLHLAGIFRIKWLDKDTRIQTSSKPAGPFGALLVGIAFAFGWTPCIGPILGGILTIAGSRDTVSEGMLLLAVYSLGLGIPFVLTALAVDKFFAASKRIRKYYRMIEYVAGGMLIVIGVLIFTNNFTVLAKAIDRWLPWLTKLT